jgi:hypothetical protein
VPWESTAAPAPETYPLAADEPLAPVRFESSPLPTHPPAEDISLPRTRRRSDEIDPDFCFNHPSEPKTIACADCGLGLCRRCSTSLGGKTLCAPCKNYRTRLAQRRPERATWAMVSFVTALIAAPLLLALTPLLVTQHVTWLMVLVSLPLWFALGAGIGGMFQIGWNPRRIGGNMALGGISLAGTVAALLLMVTVFAGKFGV